MTYRWVLVISGLSRTSGGQTSFFRYLHMFLGTLRIFFSSLHRLRSSVQGRELRKTCMRGFWLLEGQSRYDDVEWLPFTLYGFIKHYLLCFITIVLPKSKNKPKLKFYVFNPHLISNEDFITARVKVRFFFNFIDHSFFVLYGRHVCPLSPDSHFPTHRSWHSIPLFQCSVTSPVLLVHISITPSTGTKIL